MVNVSSVYPLIVSVRICELVCQKCASFLYRCLTIPFKAATVTKFKYVQKQLLSAAQLGNLS